MILALETSCDETAAALVTDDGEIRTNVVSSQADLHARYGGVVPEVASRRHLELVMPVVREALGDVSLADVDRVAVTRGPGLIGALLVGLQAAKAIAWARRLPLVPVDHLHGHVASLYVRPDRASGSEPQTWSNEPSSAPASRADGLDRDNGETGAPPKSASGSEPQSLPLEPPFLCLLASGGHTLLLDVQEHARYHVLGTTLDDAAGEAFDKGARLLGLGYPGGAEIDRLARDGDPEAFSFPVARVPGLDFSFSGVKTALLYTVRDLGDEAESRKADLAASYQRAIVRALVECTREAAAETGAEKLAVVGGVAANSELRASLPEAVPAPLPLCTDNAAMIGSAARFAEAVPYPRYLALDAYASSG
jgi:N6-L-threonylcarbamoyladenine synthase